MFRDFIEALDSSTYQSETFLDVPFVPSDETVVQAMLDLAEVRSDDVLYDLGSGDGRIPITAARERNTCGIGIDIDPVRIGDAMEEAGYSGVEMLVDFIEGDIFEADIREATVVTLYLLQSVNIELRPRLLEQLKPGTRIVSHAFDMGDWKPDDWVKLGGIHIYKWIVPADVAGIWNWQDEQGRSYRLDLSQKYQEVKGAAWIDGKKVAIENAELTGSRLELRIRDDETDLVNNFTLIIEDEEVSSVTTDG